MMQPQKLNALFLSRTVNDWMVTTHHPAILHIFDRAVNLINERRDVISVVTPQIGQGPFNLVVDDDIQFTARINVQALVSNTPNELLVGNLAINTQFAKPWDARPNWRKLHANRHSILKQVRGVPAAESELSDLQFSNSLSTSLALADLSSCVDSANKLAGLGQGLTPSGDDYIMGSLYAAWIIQPQEVAARMAREIACNAASRTTSLSSAWLRAAGNGEAGILWHVLFESLLQGERNALKSSVSNILSVGASSGADALAGFINTFNSYAELERKHVVS